MDRFLVLSLVAILTVALVTSAAMPFGHADAASKKEKKIRDEISKAIGKATEGKYSSIEILSLKKFNSNSTVVVWNKTKVTPSPTPTPEPEPQPEPTPGTATTVAFVGDLSGTAVRDAIKSKNPELVVALGDLTYKGSLADYKTNWASDDFNIIKCVIGNHDASEDGSGGIVSEAKAACGDSFWLKVGNATLVMGFNTNAKPDALLTWAKDKFSDSGFMKGIKTVIFASHKGNHVAPNSHHPAESSVKSFYSSLASAVPSGVKVIEVNAHNHVLAAASSQGWYTSGGGGRSHYECGEDATWTFCNGAKYGFLSMQIDIKTGATTGTFYDTSGNKLN
jgi:type II secretory pathway pseudopilin PulG